MQELTATTIQSTAPDWGPRPIPSVRGALAVHCGQRTFGISYWLSADSSAGPPCLRLPGRSPTSGENQPATTPWYRLRCIATGLGWSLESLHRGFWRVEPLLRNQGRRV